MSQLFQPDHPARADRAQPGLGRPDVPVLRRGRRPDDWHLVHLGSFARGRRRAGAHRGHRGLARGPDLAGRTPASGTTSRQQAWRADRRLHARPGRRGRHAARPRRAQGARPSAPWVGRAAASPTRTAAGPPVGPSRRRRSRAARARAPLDAAGIAAVVTGVRRRRRAGARGRLRPARGARRARLPAARVPLAAVEPAHRRVRRLLREPGPPAARGRRRGARRVPAGMPLLVRLSAHRLGRRRLGRRRLGARWPALLARRTASTSSTCRPAATRRPRSRVEPGYQVPFARRRPRRGRPPHRRGRPDHRAEAGRGDRWPDGAADVVLLARALLRDPHWPLRAAHELGVPVGDGVDWPEQYLRAALDSTTPTPPAARRRPPR